LATGANLSGRALARNGAVTLDTNTISKAPCAQAPAPTPIPAPSHVSVEYQCANDGRVVVVVGLTAGVIVSGLGEDITSAAGTGNNPIVRYLSPGHYEWRATPPVGSLLDVDHGVVDMATCSAPVIPTATLVPVVAPITVATRVPVVYPAAGADLGDVRASAAPQMMSYGLGLLSLGFLSFGFGLILFALRRK
jgi:hypothetical protein